MNNDIFNFEDVKKDLLSHGGGDVTIDRTYWKEGIAVLWLDHTQKRNSITGQMMVRLLYCIEELEKWKEGKAVIVCGKGVNFCSGGDFNFVKKYWNQNNASNMSKWMISILKRLAELEIVTVCAVHGATLGGGAEISTYCDYLLVAENVKYGFIQGNLGIVTAWGGGTRLIQKIGHRRALDIFLTSKVLTAEECLRLELAEKIINSENMIEEAKTWLEGYIKHDPQVVRSYKRLVKTSLKNQGTDAVYEVEIDLTRTLWGQKKHIQEIDRFMKRSSSSKAENDRNNQDG